MKMGFKKMSNWRTGVLALAIALGVAATAQSPSPTHRGGNLRQGITPLADPGPGAANLRWWHPLQSAQGADVAVDNVAVDYSEPTGTWFTPLPLDESPDWTGTGTNPYRYAFISNTSASFADQTQGATATAQWTINGTAGRLYALSVWFPSSGTRSGGVLVPNAEYAVYKIQYDNGKEFIDVVPHIGGGNWVRLGRNLGIQDRLFRASGTGQIVITLYNARAVDQNNLPISSTGRIVAADSVLAVPNPGEIWASPVAKDVGPSVGGADRIVVSVRNEAAIDPTDPDKTLQITSGKVYALDASVVNPNVSFTRWTWAPDLVTNFNDVIDDSNPAFSPDLAWTAGNLAATAFGGSYTSVPVQIANPLGTAVARFSPAFTQTAYFDIYVWFPGNQPGIDFARGARYVVEESGQPPQNFDIDQTVGGNWVRLGTRSYLNDPTISDLRVTQLDYSSNGGDLGRFIAADAVMFVGRSSSGLFSTPTMASVGIVPQGGGAPVPTECVFVAAEDGRIYCLDARGNGAQGTTVYWAYPSIPDRNNPAWTDPNDTVDGPTGNKVQTPASFGVSSMAVANVGGKDLLFIGSSNGRVYAIDCAGRGDFNAATNVAGTAQREWTWPRSRFNAGVVTNDPAREAFIGSVAFDAATSQVFIGGTEGRLFSLDAAGNGDQTTNLNWAFPLLTDPPVGAISATPAIGGGKVIFPSFDGRVYARDINGSTAPANNWQFPLAANAPLQPFTYNSVAYVPQARFLPAVASDMCYFTNDDGELYCLNGNTGTLVFQTQEPGVGAFSSPFFTSLIPSGLATNNDVVTFGGLDGSFTAYYANPAETNSAGGRLAWGYQSRGGSTFASPAVAYGWMYHAGLDGFLYAFQTGAAISNDPGFGPPGQEIATPDDPIPGVDTLLFKFISKADYSNLRSTPTVGDPTAMTDVLPSPPIPAVEWGQTLYVTAYNFIFPAPGDPPITIRFSIKGPGGLSQQYDRAAQLVAGGTAGAPNSGFATVGIPINGNGPNFFTPGTNVTVDIEVISSGRTYNTPAPPRVMIVANPLALTSLSNVVGIPAANKSIGWNTNASDPENIINGSPNKAVMSSVGDVVHGQSAKTRFYAADRSRMKELTGAGLSGARMIRGDGRWQGGLGAVQKPLPFSLGWEDLPTQVPNLSLDYPNIDRSAIDLVANPFGQSANPLLQAFGLATPTNWDPNNPADDPLNRVLTPTPIQLTWTVERYQPANLSLFTDASGANLPGGYRSRGTLYIDSNNNGRADGIEDNLANVPTSTRREAFRTLSLGVGVPVDETMAIVEPTLDLGSLPHSLGYTPMAPWQAGNLFVPDISAAGLFRNFLQPFTLENRGNVNMRDLRVATRIGQLPGPTYFSVAYNSGSTDPLAWLDAVPNLISNMNPPFAPSLGAAPDLLDASGNPRVLLPKARAGDRAPNVLTIPAVPYGVTPPANSQPVIGIAVPLGFPVGEYSQLLNVVEDDVTVGGVNDRAVLLDTNGQLLEAIADPTPKVRFLNRETRVTGGATTGTSPHVDAPLGVATNFTWTNNTPSAWRDSLGNVHLVWLSNRPSTLNTVGVPQSQDNWNLFFAELVGNAPSTTPAAAGSSPLRDTMGWIPTATRFFNPFAGPEPTVAPAALFSGPGTIIGTPSYSSPSFATNPSLTPLNTNQNSFVFWSGRAVKDTDGNGQPDVADNRIFYTEYVAQPGGGVPSLGEIKYFTYDPEVPKRRLRPVMFPQNGLAVFWHGDVNGQTRIFENALLGTVDTVDQTSNWTKPLLIDPGRGFEMTSDPTPVPIPGQAILDLIFTGRLRDVPQSEVFYSKWTRNRFGSLTQQRSLPERNREILVRETNGTTFRARGVNWVTNQPIEVWIRRPGLAPARIDVPATRQDDPNTGVISFDSSTGGKMFCDPHTGTVRFGNGSPGAGAQVEVRYTPRIIRISEMGSTGGHSGASSFLDMRINWNRTYYFTTANTPISNATFPQTARYWHFYQRGATGPGQTKRPYMKTQRLTLRLNHPIAINNLGQPIVSVAGATDVWQADPASAKVMFGLTDENRTVTVTYQWRNGAGVLQNDQVTGVVQWQTELAEQPVPIEQAVDEDSVYAFADLFNDVTSPRPPLAWVFFTSTRGGSRDVYYITVAPNFGPNVVP